MKEGRFSCGSGFFPERLSVGDSRQPIPVFVGETEKPRSDVVPEAGGSDAATPSGSTPAPEEDVKVDSQAQAQDLIQVVPEPAAEPESEAVAQLPEAAATSTAPVAREELKADAADRSWHFPGSRIHQAAYEVAEDGWYGLSAAFSYASTVLEEARVRATKKQTDAEANPARAAERSLEMPRAKVSTGSSVSSGDVESGSDRSEAATADRQAADSEVAEAEMSEADPSASSGDGPIDHLEADASERPSADPDVAEAEKSELGDEPNDQLEAAAAEMPSADPEAAEAEEAEADIPVSSENGPSHQSEEVADRTAAVPESDEAENSAADPPGSPQRQSYTPHWTDLPDSRDTPRGTAEELSDSVEESDESEEAFETNTVLPPREKPSWDWPLSRPEKQLRCALLERKMLKHDMLQELYQKKQERREKKMVKKENKALRQENSVLKAWTTPRRSSMTRTSVGSSGPSSSSASRDSVGPRNLLPVFE